MRDTELAYAAGLFDGEGHVSIGVHRVTGRRKSPCHYLYVGVTSADTSVLYWLQQRWGGSVNRKAKPSKWNHRQTYQWKATPVLAAAFLEAVKPYLLIKRKQADLALRFQAERGGQSPASQAGRGARISQATLAKRDEYRTELSRLNGRLG